MRKPNLFTATGLISSILLVIAYLYILISYLPHFSNGPLVRHIHLFSQVFVILIFFALRNILVVENKIRNLRYSIALLILTQVIIFLISVVLSYKILTVKIMFLFFPVTAMVLIALFVWFLIMVLLIKKNSVRFLSYLKLFSVTFLGFFIIRAVFVVLTTMIKSKPIPVEIIQPMSTILQCAEKLPYLFLIPFFVKYGLINDSETVVESRND
jgi:hypothetical protein